MSEMMVYAFDIENPNEVIPPMEIGEWRDMSEDERRSSNELHELHTIKAPDDRSDSNLVQLVEELGEDAFGACAKLAVIEIPDGVEWEIDEYDGMESVDEVHRSWS